MAKIWAVAASSRFFLVKPKLRTMDHGDPTGSRKEITAGEEERAMWDTSGVGGDRINVAESVASQKIRKESQRGFTPVSGRWGFKSLKPHREGDDGYRGLGNRRVSAEGIGSFRVR